MTASYVDEWGELTDDGTADPETRLAYWVRRRHAGHEQLDAWKREIAICDSILHKLLGGESTVIDDHIRCFERSQRRLKTDAQEFATGLEADEVSRDALYGVIRAANGFDKDELPEEARTAFGQASRYESSKSWIETSLVLKRAPRPPAANDDLAPALEASLATKGGAA